MKADPEKRAVRPGVKEKSAESPKTRERRIAEERGANDPKYRPTSEDAQIDASGARFKSDA